MTFLSVTDCCRLLAIDPKTLHRWLAQAQLPLQSRDKYRFFGSAGIRVGAGAVLGWV